jgi:signal transduction histidine kinase
VARSPGRARISLRQLLLFVLSMVVPSVVLVGLGVRIVDQQEELEEKYVADQQRLRASEFERALAAQLDTIRGDPNDPSVALVATIADGRLILPWDAPRSDLGVNPAFGTRIARAEREEARAEREEARGEREEARRRLDAALSELAAALAGASSDRERADARLLRARVFAKAQRPAEADRDYRALLAVPVSVRDEHGMPFALYAADRLLTSGRARDADRAAIAAFADAVSQGSVPLPPAVWYQLRRIDEAMTSASAVAPPARRDRIAHRIADVEHAVELQRDVQALITQWKASEGAWLPHGAPLWLIGVSSLASTAGRTVVAVRAEALLKARADLAVLQGAEIELATAGGAGEWLSGRFPGLRVKLPPVDLSTRQRPLQGGVYAAGLVIILSVTLFGGYLLWRDVNREMRVAALRSQFVSSVSHELKTPLTAIRMFAETLQLDRVDPPTRTEYLDTIVSETERLTRLLNNVLDFSKIEEGRKGYRRETATLGDVVRAAARAMAYPLEQHGFVLKVDIDDSLPPAHVDPDALEQAILNLLTNAMKYSGSGRTIDLRLAREGREAIISVRDEGIGIAAADQARIFGKFYRISTPENQRIPGTGLGLTIVDHIVKAHDGAVRVESAPGRGSVFSIHLPLPPDDATPLVVEAVS